MDPRLLRAFMSDVRYSTVSKGTLIDWAERAEDGEFASFALIVFTGDGMSSVLTPDASRWSREKLTDFLYGCFDALRDWSKQYEN